MKKWFSQNRWFLLTVFFLCILMFYFINQKQGFHEDEIFSYGSSNYRYDNVYRPYGYAEASQDVFYNQVWNSKNKITNIKNYFFHYDTLKTDETLSKEIPIFRQKEDALTYLTIGKGDVLNYFSVYYNQARDVHPPLFYFLVHFVSTIFYGQFSKYIIFTINLVFFVGTLWIIKKIMEKLDIKKMAIPTMILYGASMGCISTVMFQRMYMMLTFFSVLYLYLTIKFVQEDFKIEKKYPWIFTILFGFLTQYYFCIYIVFVFLLVSAYLLTKKEYQKLGRYFLVHVIAAVIGILFYPASIYHIFFSYRGLGDGREVAKPIIQSCIYYFSQIYKLFSMKHLLFLILVLYFILILKNKAKIDREKIFYCSLIFLPSVMYLFTIAKIAPFLGEDYTSRYIMLLFPIIAVGVAYLFSFATKKQGIFFTISLLLSVNGLYYNEPVYLYKDYQKAMDIATIYKDDYFVYVYDNSFTHLSSLPEFATYKASLIINENNYDFSLLENDELINSNEFILCIKNWLNVEDILNKVLEGSHYTKYEKLLELKSDVESTYYKIIK
ncbi:MAG: glycosyltransferase family 39 protein [Tenericutes bacterium]|nr:glycosyltransferase family 39 protein [Mycoplasmatota bacterium]